MMVIIKKFLKMIIPLKIRLVIRNVIEKFNLMIAYKKLSNSRNVIIVYQMGKVGSSSIYKMLKNKKLVAPVFQVHFLSNKGIENTEKYFQGLYKPKKGALEINKMLCKELAKSFNKKNWKIISLVRDPIARAISDFFQNVESYYPELIKKNGALDLTLTNRHLQKLFDEFDEKMDYASNWFDKELNTVFNIDIYSYPFNKTEGFGIIKNGSVEVLLFTLEKLNDCYQNAIFDLIGVSGMRLVNVNIGAKKKFADSYKYIKQNLRLPNQVCKKIYSTKSAKHFYSEKKINEFIEKWSEDDHSNI